MKSMFRFDDARGPTQPINGATLRDWYNNRVFTWPTTGFLPPGEPAKGPGPHAYGA